MASILHWIDIRRPGKDTNPDDAFWQTRILAEGDSWFTLGGLPEQCNLLQSLTLPNRTIIVSLAKPGDTIRLSYANNFYLNDNGNNKTTFLTDSSFNNPWVPK